MFCPGCGLEEIHSNQFCRACGTDLRLVRFAIESPDEITASAISARNEIGRAVAAKIRETQSAYELKKVAEDVLPEIEKFLESPEEKRLRRMRAGTIISSVGLGVALTFLLMVSRGSTDALIMVGAGLITFFIGLGFILNAMLFSIPKKGLSDKSSDAENQRELDAATSQTGSNFAAASEPSLIISSVTEHTTQHLKEKQLIPRS